MVTLLLTLMVACNLWILFYLTWEHKGARKADGKDGIEPAREPLPDVIGKEATVYHSDAKCCHGNAE